MWKPRWLKEWIDPRELCARVGYHKNGYEWRKGYVQPENEPPGAAYYTTQIRPVCLHCHIPLDTTGFKTVSVTHQPTLLQSEADELWLEANGEIWYEGGYAEQQGELLHVA